MTFGVTPVMGFTPANTEDFPNYIQFQWNGVNLGGPDADTINFVGNFTLSRDGNNNDGPTITITMG
jgi:hypothetical protein